ncbi:MULTISPECIES: hypothetical protein [unclassified Pseudofrankia]|uniref:hypothetical protein n=1 Tax=unclassified Pseudofrankia TaxID=2994372 RepID=UPI0008D94F8F|nr:MULTISPECIES: hypothetical protein [unclassified Pseudofrankia]MDT3446804.1 hypothetical protein [Pseudofrankia sp. BMG5.37]OHV57157.1 hypothetical protein BCD48_43365 [Pseudofrankia sp. BMG5.36]
MHPEEGLDYEAIATAVMTVPDRLSYMAALGAALSGAWAERYRRLVGSSYLHEIPLDGSTLLFDLASAAGAPQADRTVAAWGVTRRPAAPRDVAYQRGYPSPRGRASRPLDKGHMVPHTAGGEFGPNIFPQDRDLNRGWSAEGRRYRALEREITDWPGTFFFSHLLYADESDFPQTVELGVLRTDGLYVEQFRNRFDA